MSVRMVFRLHTDSRKVKICTRKKKMNEHCRQKYTFVLFYVSMPMSRVDTAALGQFCAEVIT